ncbi:inositol-3-phosphate synthase [Escherichia coli]|uniref:inositol-3-phosphate synthase n=2 Tax=Escherichia coli TaxID=562 RepID=UPI0013F5BE19|nr:inositol-3-phosphate synthase [Escherichia coli]QIL68611.1 hypothetical protein F0L67_27900 [Escherichia coli]
METERGEQNEEVPLRVLNIPPADGRLAVFLPGLGAVATTMIAGVMLARKGKAVPVGSMTQLGTIDLDEAGGGTSSPLIRDWAPLAALEQMDFAAWDHRVFCQVQAENFLEIRRDNT